MSFRRTFSSPLIWTLALGLCAAAAVATRAQDAHTPITVGTSKVTIAGTTNVHDYSVATSVVKLARVQLTSPCANWDDVLKAGALQAFEIAIPALSLKSGDEGLDKNMYKALKTQANADITFRVNTLEPGAAGALKAAGTLKIAGVEKPVTLNVTTERQGAALVVKGSLPILMTDYGITPPKAMLGMLKTDPKIVVSFTTALSLGE